MSVLCFYVIDSCDIYCVFTAQGLGYYTVEEHRFGADGCLEIHGADGYHIPSVSLVPLQMNVTLLKDAGNPKAVYSSKVLHSGVENSTELNSVIGRCDCRLYVVEKVVARHYGICCVWCTCQPDISTKIRLFKNCLLTPSAPAIRNCCCSKGSVPYWSNPPFLVFAIRALWRSVLSARAPEWQKLKMVG